MPLSATNVISLFLPSNPPVLVAFEPYRDACDPTRSPGYSARARATARPPHTGPARVRALPSYLGIWLSLGVQSRVPSLRSRARPTLPPDAAPPAAGTILFAASSSRYPHSVVNEDLVLLQGKLRGGFFEGPNELLPLGELAGGPGPHSFRRVLRTWHGTSLSLQTLQEPHVSGQRRRPRYCTADGDPERRTLLRRTLLYRGDRVTHLRFRVVE